MSDEPKKIDINQPVDQGHDVVINKQDGSQVLGTAEEAAKASEAGETNGEHTNAAPVVAPDDKEAPAEEAPAEVEKPKKSSSKK